MLRFPFNGVTMSLEQAITDLTAAVKALHTAFATAGNPFPVNAAPAGAAPAEPEKKGPGRPKKVVEPVDTTPIPETGDPAGTKYFYNAQHNTVFSVKPGEKNELAGVAITPAEFVAKTEAAKAAAAATPDPFAAPTPAADPFAAAAPTPKSAQEVTELLMKIAHSKSPGHGREAVIGILSKYGIANVNQLGTVDTTAAYADAERLFTTGAL